MRIPQQIMWRLFENSKINLNLSPGDVDMGGYVTLWHGSPLENLESILENGIVPNKSKVDAEERVEQAIYEIAERLKLGGEAVHEMRALHSMTMGVQDMSMTMRGNTKQPLTPFFYSFLCKSKTNGLW
jgi:hypothetical protein